jgi:hypothetical protein
MSGRKKPSSVELSASGVGAGSSSLPLGSSSTSTTANPEKYKVYSLVQSLAQHFRLDATDTSLHHHVDQLMKPSATNAHLAKVGCAVSLHLRLLLLFSYADDQPLALGPQNVINAAVSKLAERSTSSKAFRDKYSEIHLVQ